MKHHIVVTGPGRAGTSFLMQLLTRMGIETGFKPYDEPFDAEGIRAGCEYDLNINDELTHAQIRSRLEEVPFVFKAPDWSWRMKEYLHYNLTIIDHVILPFRDFDLAAKSRLDAGLAWMVDESIQDELERVGVQAAVHAAMFGRALEACYLYRIPVSILRFPLLVESAEYCFERLNRVFKFHSSQQEVFREMHQELSWVKERIAA